MTRIEEVVQKLKGTDEERRGWVQLYEMMNDEGKQEFLALLESQAQQ